MWSSGVPTYQVPNPWRASSSSNATGTDSEANNRKSVAYLCGGSSMASPAALQASNPPPR